MFQLPKQTAYFTIIIANIIPIFGIIYWGWTPFYVFWLFWLETLIVSVFNAVKIIMCRGDEMDEKLQKGNLQFSKIHVNQLSHWRKAFSYLLIRIFIFAFYSLFIIVFLGFMGNSPENSVKNAQVLAFANTTFNYALLAFFCNQLVQFFAEFILNENYKKTHPSDFSSIFDGRQMVLHIAIVLGVMISQFIVKADTQNTTSMVIVVVVFAIIKTLYDIWAYRGIKNLFVVRNLLENGGR